MNHEDIMLNKSSKTKEDILFILCIHTYWSFQFKKFKNTQHLF